MRMLGNEPLWLGLMVPALLLGPLGMAAPATVTIDGARTYQVIEGFGVNANYWSWNNTELQPVVDALIDDAGMTLFRVVFNQGWEETNDNANSSLMNWDYYNVLYDGSEFQKLWGLMAYLNQKGITNGVMLNFQGHGPDWMCIPWQNQLTPGYEDEWAEMIVSLLLYARNTRHLQFNLVAPHNEPDIASEGIGMVSASQYVTTLQRLAQQLDTNGLGDVRLVVPDRSNSGTNWLPETMSDPLVMSKLAHFGLHSYSDWGTMSSGVGDLIRQSAYPDRTFWMTEFNVWCSSCEAGLGNTNDWDYCRGTAEYLLCDLVNGATAGLVWEGYDSYYPHHGCWSFWGLLGVDDPNATPRTYTRRKNFYTLAQIAKFVRPGAKRIEAGDWSDPFLLLGFYQPDTGQITLTGENTDATPTTLSGALTNLPPVISLDLFYTDRATNLCHSATIPVSNGTFAVTIPGDCVFTLVGFDPGASAVSVAITNPLNGASFSAPATIPIQATAATTTGSVTCVEFFCGATSLGQALAEPYNITWSNVPPGAYVLTARATNSIGNFGVSAGAQVTVVGPTAQISVTPSDFIVVPYGTQQLTATAADECGTIIEPPPQFTWSVSGGGVIDANGLFTAGGSVDGPFVIAASYSNVTGTASVTVATNFNLAPAGLGYTWYSLTNATDDWPQAVAPGINDGDLDTDVPLLPGGAWDIQGAYEAGGVIWPTPQAVDRVIYYNGSYTTDHDGVFTESFGLQFSPDGATWTNAGSEWILSPPYVYNSPASANVAFTFTGGMTTVRGVRCVGRVHHRSNTSDSWLAFATELEAFAAAIEPVGPQITVQPISQAVPVGTTADFSVVASGTAPLSYQWLFNDANLGGAVAATLSLTNVQPEQAGSYSVVVTNVAGSVTSVVATLNALVLPPVITLEPTNQALPVGATVDFSVVVSGTAPLSYQWLFNGTNLDGAAAETLSLTNVQPEQAGSYCVVVTNSASSATSAVATLTVLHYPLLLDPRMATNGAFAFTLSGDTGFTYTIEVSTNFVEWAPFTTLSNVAGQSDFTDSTSSNSASRFYRARLVY